MIPRPYESYGGDSREMPAEYFELLAEQVAWQHLGNEVIFAPVEREMARRCPHSQPRRPHYHLVAWLAVQNTWAVASMSDTRLHTAN